MFQKRTQYAGVESTSEQHILTVLRFHEVRLGKIEKHIVHTNKQLQQLISAYQKKTTSSNVVKQEVKNDTFNLLKNMMENLTNQVITSQAFMKEIKEEVSKIKQPSFKKEEEKAKPTKTDDKYYTNHKLLELERDIAKAQLISIGMEPTLDRIDEYVERMRRDRKRFLSDKSESNNETQENTNDTQENTENEYNDVISSNETQEASSAEEEENVIVDEKILEQNLENLNSVREEVSLAIDKIPVVFKPRKKRGRPKKKH
jgi:hypothetical protein